MHRSGAARQTSRGKSRPKQPEVWCFFPRYLVELTFHSFTYVGSLAMYEKGIGPGVPTV